MADIETYAPRTGRMIREDNSVVNITDRLNNQIRQTQIGADQSASFAASALVNTTKIVDVVKPDAAVLEYELIVLNPSTVSDLVVKLYNRETLLNGETRRSLVIPFGFAKATIGLIHACEDTWAEQVVAGVALAVDTDAGDYKVGTKSASFTMTGVGGDTILGSEDVSGVAVCDNLTMYTHIRMWIRCSIAVAAGGLQLLLDNTALCASPLESINIPTLEANIWALVYLPLANPSALIDIKSVGIKQVTNLDNCVIWIDDVQAVDISPQSRFVHGIFNGADLRMVISNDTALGANDAFDAYIRIREVQ